MNKIRELLLEVDVALEEYSLHIARARDPALTPADRLKLIEACAVIWQNLDAAQRHLQQEVALVNKTQDGSHSTAQPVFRIAGIR